MIHYDIYLDGNPINCTCETHRMYKYLVSHFNSERSNAKLENLPDFSFYVNEWKCMYPLQWVGIPLIKIPEYESNVCS